MEDVNVSSTVLPWSSSILPVVMENSSQATHSVAYCYTGDLQIIIPITVVYCLIFVIGIFGNIATCIVIYRNKAMHTATNYYLFSLAVSDLLVLVSSMPVELYEFWCPYRFVFGELFCILRGLISEFCTNATVLTVLTFTIERYVAICHPFLSHTLSKLSRAKKIIVIVWLISLTYAIPQALSLGVNNLEGGYLLCQWKKEIIQHSFEISAFFFFLAPMILITVLYILIGLKLRASTKINRNTASHQKRYQNSTQGSRRVIKMLVWVVVAFFSCWAPFHAQRLIYVHCMKHKNEGLLCKDYYPWIQFISGVLYYFSLCVNPLLYNIMSHKFREAFKETLAKMCFSTTEHDEKRTYRVLSRSQRRLYGPSSSKQESSEYSGNSYRDATQFASSLSKTAGEAITLSLGGAGRQQTPFTGFTGNFPAHHHVMGRASSEDTALRGSDARISLNESTSASGVYQRHSNINIETELGKEIHLNIFPRQSTLSMNHGSHFRGHTADNLINVVNYLNNDSGDNVAYSTPKDALMTPSGAGIVIGSNKNPPAVNINIDVASDTNNSRRCANDSNISVVYNRSGNIRIAIAHDDPKLKMKRIKRGGGVHKPRLLRMFAFRRTKTLHDFHEQWFFGQAVQSELKTCDAGYAQQENSIIFNESHRDGSFRHENSVNRDNRHADKYRSCEFRSRRDENELDTYMRELRSRKCI